MKLKNKYLKKKKSCNFLNTLVAAFFVGSMFNPVFSEPATEQTIQAEDIYKKPADTATMTFLNGKNVELPDGSQIKFEEESSYSLTSTDASATTANVFTRAIYDETTQSVTSQNYEITIDPYFTLSGANSVNTDIINGGTFTTYYDVAGSRAALGSEKTATQRVGNFCGLTTTSYGGVFINQGTLGLLGGNFIGNHAESYGGSVLFNYIGTVNDVSGIFIGNNVTPTGSSKFGGAILNYGGNVKNIVGYFLGNTSTEYGGAISLVSYPAAGLYATSDNIIGDFIGNKATKDGGAIFVYEGSKVGNIIGDFIGNTASDGSAIYNYESSIDNISGDFIGNKATSGGVVTNYYQSNIKNISGNFSNNTGNAIYNYSSHIDNIEGNFSSNIGNAIYNYSGNIDKIKGTFTNHTADVAILNYQEATIKSIEGNFIDNNLPIMNSFSRIDKIKGTFINNISQGTGGAIYNGAGKIAFGAAIPDATPYIGTIEGIFIGNGADIQGTDAGSQAGGAIANGNIFGESIIDVITGTFKNNYVIGRGAHGGAIENGNGVINKIVNSTFIGNYAKGCTSEYNGYGGAISSYNDLYLESNDGFDFTFEGNYVQSGDGDKDYQAIYLTKNYLSGEASTLTMNAKEDGKFTFKDGIKGIDGYANLVIKSEDSTGQFDFSNYITGFDTTVQNALVNFLYADDKITDYTQKSLNITSGDVNLTLDIKGSNGTTDTLTTSESSSGTINISDIDFIDSATAGSTAKYKILNTNEGLGLTLSKNKYIVGETTQTLGAIVTADIDVVSNDQLKKRTQSGDVYNEVAVDTTSTTNDSIAVTYGLVDYNGEIVDTDESAGDTLNLWNTTASGAVKNFNLTSANQVYTSLADVGYSTDGTSNVNGKTEDDGSGNITRSTIDLNGHEGFSVSKDVTLNINNVKIQNAIGSETRNGAVILAKHGVLNIDNSVFDNNKSSSAQRAGAICLFDGTSEIAFGGSAATTPGTKASITNTIFSNNSAGSGGAIYTEGAEITEITGAFINNTALGTGSTQGGGAIYQAKGYTSNPNIIRTITADFTGNSATSGGAIYITKTVDNIESSNFNNNTASYQGGVFYNVGILNTIQNSTFTGNSATDNGGVLMNTASAQVGTIKNSEFTDNESGNYGGALYLNTSSKITKIQDSVFTGNSSTTGGGAIYMTKATIGTIENTTFSGNYSKKAGAIYIYNNSSIGNIINSNFYDNHITNGTGSAIDTATDLKITADNGTSTFRGNYYQPVPTYKKTYNAIYTAANKTITLNAVNDGIITFYDGITGATAGYNLNLTGDATGVINFINGFDTVEDGNTVHTNTIAQTQYANIAVNNGVTANFNYIDNTLTNYAPKSININNGTINLALDVNASTKKSDTITVTGASSGTININDINWIVPLSTTTPAGADWKVKVLTQPEGSALTLALADSLKTNEYLINKTSRTDTHTEDDTVTPVIKSTDKFYNREYQDTIEVLHNGKLTTDGDYITLEETSTADGEILDSTLTGNDTELNSLKLLAQLNTTENREFNFVSADETYTVISDIGNVTDGQLSINGQISDDGSGNITRSTIDMNGHSGFEVLDGDTLNIKDVKIENAVVRPLGYGSVVSALHGTVNIDNSVFRNNNSNPNGNGGAVSLSDGTSSIFGSPGAKSSATIQNTTFDSNQAYRGGAIYAEGSEIDVLTGSFTNNTSTENGGAIFLATATNPGASIGKIESLTATFENNTATQGGAIYNSNGVITDITGSTFDGNKSTQGGAIANNGTISNIKDSTFANNSLTIAGIGGAIYNAANKTIGTIEDTQFNNNTGAAYGGAIANYGGTITDIKNTNFKENQSTGFGGAIFNYNTGSNKINSIIGGTFENNSATEYGGAILNYTGSTIGSINGTTFKGNSAQAGGAITNLGTIGDIVNSNFYGNYANEGGGAILADGNLKISAVNGTSTFKGNYELVDAGDGTKTPVYRAIHMNNVDTTLTLNAENGTITFNDAIRGDSYNINVVGDSNGVVNFINGFNDGENDIDSVASFNNANLTVNDGVTVNLDYADGYTDSYTPGSINIVNGAINLALDIDAASGAFDNLTTTATSGGTININDINFMNSNAKDLCSTATYKILNTNEGLGLSLSKTKYYTGTITDLWSDTVTADIDVVSNDQFRKHSKDGKLYNEVALATSDTTNDSLSVTYNLKDMVGEVVDLGSAGDTLALWNTADVTETEKNFNFTSENQTYQVSSKVGSSTADTLNINGYSDGNSVIDLQNNTGFELDKATDLNLNDVKLTGNTDLITVTNTEANVSLKNANIDGNISSTVAYDLAISGNTSINGTVGTANTTISNGTNLTVARNDAFAQSNVIINDGVTLNLANNLAQDQIANSYNIMGNISMFVDADLANITMDRLPVNTTVTPGSFINIKGINLLSDARDQFTKIPFAYNGFKNNVKYTGAAELSDKTQITTVYAPIYKYSVKYDPANGMFEFNRGGNNPSYSEINPAVVSAPVAAEVGAYTGMVYTYDMAFNTMDMRMTMPLKIREAMANSNKYASLDENGKTYNLNEYNSPSAWVKPYTSYDSIRLQGGPKVNSTTYGSFIGADSEIYKLKNGFEAEISPYISYMGSHQTYANTSIYQNGGALGLVGSLYKGNFFTGLTVSAGATVAEESSVYGNADFPMLMAGVASKTGYDFEFKDGSFIVQPSMLLSYTFINTFDYKNGADVDISSKPLNTIQLAPTLKLIKHTKKGWEPYLLVGMRWNLLGKSDVKANDVNLPNLSVKPYVEYGVGVQKRAGERFSGFAQATVRNGGRNGVAGMLGLKILLGKDKPKNDSSNLSSHRTIIKQK